MLRVADYYIYISTTAAAVAFVCIWGDVERSKGYEVVLVLHRKSVSCIAMLLAFDSDVWFVSCDRYVCGVPANDEWSGASGMSGEARE